MNLRKIKPFWLALSAFVVATLSSVPHSLIVYWVFLSTMLSPGSTVSPVGSVIPMRVLYSMRFFVPLTVLTWILLVAWNRGQYVWVRLLAGITGSALLAYGSWLLLSPGRSAQSLASGAFIVFTAPHMCWALLLLAFALFARNPRPVTHGALEVQQ